MVYFLSAFLLCWWPYAICFVLGSFEEEDAERETPHYLLKNIVILAYLDSLINPLLYIAIKKDVREALRNLILCRDLAEYERLLRNTSALLNN